MAHDDFFQPKLLIPIILLLIVAGLLTVLAFKYPPAFDGLQERLATTPLPTEQTGVTVDIRLEQPTVKYGELLFIPVFVTNHSADTIETTFPTTCTTPQLLVDSQPLTADLVCGQALTAVKLAAGQSERYRQVIRFVRPEEDIQDLDTTIGVNTGLHTLVAAWADYTSAEVTIHVGD